MSVRRLGLGQPLGWATIAILVALYGHLVSSAPTAYPKFSGSASNCAKQASRTVFPVLKFIIANYITHAFTIKFSPGFGLIYTLMFSMCSLFFPYFGLVGAVRNIEQLAVFADSPLESAARSGALCTLARTRKWSPKRGDKVWLWWKRGLVKGGEFATIDHHALGLENLPRHFIKLHGMCHPPRCVDPETKKEIKVEPTHTAAKEQYMLVRLPPYYKVQWNPNHPGPEENPEFQESKYNTCRSWREQIEEDYIMTLWNKLLSCCCGKRKSEPEQTSRLSMYDIGVSSSLGVLKGFIALVQLYSVVSYIKAEKYERNRINDYAAFQLTLIPYGLMSVVNIVCGLVTPTYSAVYMVNSTVMEEARNRGWTFDGTVGTLCEDKEEGTKEGKDKEGKAKKENLCAGFLATFEGDGGVGADKGGQMGASTEDNYDRIRRAETNPPPEANKSELTEVGLKINISAESKNIKRKRRQYAWHIFKEIWKEVMVIRWFLIKDQDPGKEYAKFLLYSEKSGGSEAADETTQIVISPIGNPNYRKGSWWRFPMIVISDIIVLVSLALPHVVTWNLTKYKAPIGGKLYGIVFLLWLALGQFSPVPARVTWGFIQSRHLDSSKRGIYYASIIFLGALWSIPAIWGFILVGKGKYIHLYGVNSG